MNMLHCSAHSKQQKQKLLLFSNHGISRWIKMLKQCWLFPLMEMEIKFEKFNLKFYDSTLKAFALTGIRIYTHTADVVLSIYPTD